MAIDVPDLPEVADVVAGEQRDGRLPAPQRRSLSTARATALAVPLDSLLVRFTAAVSCRWEPWQGASTAAPAAQCDPLRRRHPIDGQGPAAVPVVLVLVVARLPVLETCQP